MIEYGNAVNVMYVVETYEKTEITAIQLEDQLHQNMQSYAQT